MYIYTAYVVVVVRYLAVYTFPSPNIQSQKFTHLLDFILLSVDVGVMTLHTYRLFNIIEHHHHQNETVETILCVYRVSFTNL